MNIFDWTPEATGRLKQLADGTRSATEIAAALGCARNGVIGKLTRLRAAGKIDANVRLLPSGGNHGRGIGKGRRQKSGEARAARPTTARFVPARSKPKAPTFVASRAEGAPAGRRAADDARSGLRASPDIIPSDHALVLPPIGFLDAVERRRCLFFAGDPYGPAGPDMPVCGAERPFGGSALLPPYCVRHLHLRYQPRAEARAAA